MRVIAGLDNPLLQPARRVVAEGAFDGVHRGHQALLEAAAQAAKQYQAELAVLTFEPAPVEIFGPHDSHNIRLTLKDERQRELAKHGAQVLIVAAFDEALRQTPARAFAQRYMRDRLGAVVVVVSENHTWGHRAEADVDLMRELGGQFGFAVHLVPLSAGDGQPTSSSRIRQLLWAGEVDRAAQLLGRPYSLSGVVGSGAGRGRRLGFPTANLAIPEVKLVPGPGVYAALAQVEGRRGPTAVSDYEGWPAVVSVGTSPTFAESSDPRLVEVHLPDFAGDLYATTVTVHFLQRLRDQRAFDCEAALQAQIAADIEELRRRLTLPGGWTAARPAHG